MVTTRPPKTIVKPTALGPVANTDTKLLIYGLFQEGRVLAQDGDCGSMNRFSVWWTEAKVSARHSSTFWGISWSSKDANSTNSEIYARTFPSPARS